LAIVRADADHHGQVPHGRPPAFKRAMKFGILRVEKAINNRPKTNQPPSLQVTGRLAPR